MTARYVQAFHSVITDIDEMASDPANIDLAAMLAFFIQPRVVVEAGTYQGHLTLAVANILRIQGYGKIYTADPIDHVARTLAHPDVAQLLPHIHYHPGTFEELLEQVPGEIDLAYLDASSVDDPGMRMAHYKAVYPRLRNGGIAMIDDTEGEWDDAPTFRRVASIHLSQRRGLTLIQKHPHA
jgi:predicted O-methyltransferase YrrM